MTTFNTKPKDIQRQWHLIDASGQALGRLASQVAHLLRGKHKPYFVPHLDTGDFVVVVNAAKIRVTGGKEGKKFYYRHSMYPGGFKAVTYEKLQKAHPDRPLMEAVKGMLPPSRLGRAMLKKLKVYPGPDHPHQAQIKAEGKGEQS
ncbi:MAG: 50S ribosomal protein L13 [Chloroflexi bacterium]|nr:50S ribosomal protein L13 [Chloroflexota bacterium]